MAVFYAWQVIRQRLAPSACTLRLLRSRQRQLLDFCLNGRNIGLPVFFEQTQLWLRQCFALRTVANAAKMCQFQHQCLILRFQQLELVLCLRKQRLNQVRYLGFGFRREAQMIQFNRLFCVHFHGVIIS